MRMVMLALLVLVALSACKKSGGGMVIGGGAGAGGGAGTGTACSAMATSAPPAMLHMAAHDVLGVASPCGFSSCHMGSNARAHLDLLDAANLKTALVGKPACEAPNLPLVDGSGGDAALAKSYLWIKLTGAVDVSAAIVANPAWGTPGADCGQMGQPNGVRMPLTNTDMLLDEPRLSAIRNWICAGAPGP
jgi:hypothetical protein